MFQRLNLSNLPFGGYLWLFCCLILIPACTYHNEEDLFPGGCNTIDVSYTQDILPIISGTCYVCHDSFNRQGNVVLEGYDNIKVYVNNGKLVGAIKRQAGFSAMPKDQPALPDCQIDKIAQWVLDGAPNN